MIFRRLESKRISLTQRSVDGQRETAAILDDHGSRIKLHRRVVEQEGDVAHLHLAVVEVEPSPDVLHLQLDGPARVHPRQGRAPDHQPHARLGPRRDRDMVLVRPARLDMDLGRRRRWSPWG